MEEEFRELSVKDLTYKPRKNYSYIIANAILESICYHNKINEPLEVSQFKDVDFYNCIDGNEDIFEVLNKSANIHKEATRIIRIFDLVKYKRPEYELSTQKWFKDNDFSIEDNIVLKELMPLLLYYVGNCYEGSYTLFFKKLDFLIEYVIKPAIEHNESFEKERYIINSMNSSEEVLILDEDNNEILVVAVKIKLCRASHNKVEKILVYESNEDSTIKETSIDKVVLKQKIFNEKITNNSFIPMHSYKTLTNFGNNYLEEKENSYIEVILECDTVVFEYFKIKPFVKSMKTYTTEEELQEFHQTIEVIPKDNKFYIVALDTEEMILSTVLHCLPYAVILRNNDLNEKLIKKFKDYAQKSDIEICPPIEPVPNNDINSSSNNELKKEENNSEFKKSETKLSKEQEEKINKTLSGLNDPSNRI